MFAGYYKDEDRSRAAFTEDGYYKTGDVVNIDNSGDDCKIKVRSLGILHILPNAPGARPAYV